MKRPHGIISLNEEGYTNPAMNGVRERLDWRDIETKKGSYNWKSIDDVIAKAKANSKQLGLSVSMLSVFPSDIKTAKVHVLPKTDSGNQWKILFPWHPEVLDRMLAFDAALCKHVDGQVDYLAMGGLGCNIESYITPDPADIQMTSKDAIAAWVGSCTPICDCFGANLKETPFIFTASKPYASTDASNAMVALIRAMAAKYALFGVMDCSLKATSKAEDYPPHALVHDLSPTHITLLQFVTSSGGFGGHDLDGTLQETLTAAEKLLAHAVEVYPIDSKNKANAAAFIASAAKLAK